MASRDTQRGAVICTRPAFAMLWRGRHACHHSCRGSRVGCNVACPPVGRTRRVASWPRRPRDRELLVRIPQLIGQTCTLRKDCFGMTPKPAHETRALPQRRTQWTALNRNSAQAHRANQSSPLKPAQPDNAQQPARYCCRLRHDRAVYLDVIDNVLEIAAH
jgi:hypothetical protein